MKDPEKLVRAAAVLALVGLALFAWSVLDPRPVPVVVAMSVGQAIGTLSFLLYVLAIYLDLRRARVLGKGADAAEKPGA
jgi:hypothetical protein